MLVISGLAAVVLVGFIAYAVSVATRHPSTSSSVTLGAGTTAPPFTLERLGGGPPVQLAKLVAGRPAVVNFFASWCTDCRAELAAFGSVSQQRAGHVVFIGVDSNDLNPRLARSLLAAGRDRYPVGVDQNGATAITYLVPGLPTTVFIDRRGRVVDETFGALTRAQLQQRVAQLEAGPTK